MDAVLQRLVENTGFFWDTVGICIHKDEADLPVVLSELLDDLGIKKADPILDAACRHRVPERAALRTRLRAVAVQ